MAKKAPAENSKKAAGNARKAETANKKRAEEDAKVQALEEEDWSKGSKKGNKKREDEAEKKAEAARKKAERDAALKEEEDSLPSKPSAKGRGAAKVAAKKTGKIDDFMDFSKVGSISATGIEDALDALTLATTTNGGFSAKDIDRHPERRYKAAYAAYEETRVPELRKEHPGLRLQQVKQLVHKEFEKSPENPFNQITVDYNTKREEVSELKQKLKTEKEKRFA
ncbi:hypothetical protein BABINDRAFT_6789 [Babjeviella inositovora NRRL Y-12698]|uniref:HMG box domain-containing protein n=1 Tax=Babjeviella inositovora NRRL Y-12698 TaxID=984486 RepID=A0A1E3QTD0_9ASCO|nr:uncharacterized protein BABINDRAFT_6789 [Babjeviella inositovora NRRL Y-12698]ODQ80918.1 hypothetical protein BABINDRAFT_6789 [Babjeviella inositovora NRRL Y-12698]